MRKTGPNQIIMLPSCKIGIILNSPKYGDHLAIVDSTDYFKIKEFRWSLQKTERLSYAICKSKIRYLHKHIFPQWDIIDHIDGNGLNNSKSNLRLCTAATNSMNRRPNIGQKTKGIYKLPSEKFRVRVSFCGRRIDVGSFTRLTDAIEAYNLKVKELHKDFAKLI